MLTFKHHHFLNALEIRLQMQDAIFAALENKANQYITINGIVIAILIGLLALSDIREIPQLMSFVLYCVLLIILLFVCRVFYHCYKALEPQEWSVPISLDGGWLDYLKTAEDMPYHERVLDTYWEIIRDHNTVLSKKAKHVTQAQRAIAIQLVIILATLLVIILLLLGKLLF